MYYLLYGGISINAPINTGIINAAFQATYCIVYTIGF
jgi:hypothetical protein